jgi:hypothetical protein
MFTRLKKIARFELKRRRRIYFQPFSKHWSSRLKERREYSINSAGEYRSTQLTARNKNAIPIRWRKSIELDWRKRHKFHARSVDKAIRSSNRRARVDLISFRWNRFNRFNSRSERLINSILRRETWFKCSMCHRILIESNQREKELYDVPFVEDNRSSWVVEIERDISSIISMLSNIDRVRLLKERRQRRSIYFQAWNDSTRREKGRCHVQFVEEENRSSWVVERKGKPISCPLRNIDRVKSKKKEKCNVSSVSEYGRVNSKKVYLNVPYVRIHKWMNQ